MKIPIFLKRWFIASEDKGTNKYLQVHRVTFYKKDGTKITTLTENLASNMECSEGAVTVNVVSSILGANGAQATEVRL